MELYVVNFQTFLSSFLAFAGPQGLFHTRNPRTPTPGLPPVLAKLLEHEDESVAAEGTHTYLLTHKCTHTRTRMRTLTHTRARSMRTSTLPQKAHPYTHARTPHKYTRTHARTRARAHNSSWASFVFPVTCIHAHPYKPTLRTRTHPHYGYASTHTPGAWVLCFLSSRDDQAATALAQGGGVAALVGALHRSQVCIKP